MKFAEVIVFEVLEKRGYLSPSLLRVCNQCRWYTVRKGNELYEVEAYDAESFGSDGLKQYLDSLAALPDSNKFLRKPVEVIAERKITCVIRRHFEGEPIYTYFIRPGQLPVDKASFSVKSFEGVHKYLQDNNIGNFAPLSIMFFLTESGKVLIDGLKCGPWVKGYEHLTLISNYLNPELSWEKQVNFFRNSFALKVFTGNPKADKVEDGYPAAINSFINGAIKDKANYQGNLSVLEKKHRPKTRGFLTKAFLVTAVFILPLIAYLIRVLQSDSSWMGAAYTEQVSDDKKFEERDEFAFEPDAEVKVDVSHEFLQTSLQIREMMLAGNFSTALDEITELSSINLRKGELEILNEIRKAYPELRKKDFEKAIELSQSYITKEQYDDAVLVLNDIVERYRKGKDTEQAMAAIQKIKDLQESRKLQKQEEIEREAASVEKDRKMILTMDKLQAESIQSPVKFLDARNRRLDLIRLECITAAAKYLVNCAMKMNAAEKRLYEQLLQFSTEDDKKSRIKLLAQHISALSGVEVYDITESGIEFKDVSGGGSLKFANISSEAMYNVFKETSAVDVERAAYYLYLYCLKYGLQKEADVEFQLIKNSELKKEADSLRDMNEARRDLFAEKQ
ncbi:MAG: hypothetical protein NE327_02865 [Lentisphaeraceae bacterium]|nr:hypothetical protein [Lentisphaeraceae bacterium]